nr:sucrase ferredoxin [Sciscionella marina]
MLIEHPGPWDRLALSSPGLVPEAMAALAGWADSANARIALVRRHGRPGNPTRPRRWFRIDARPGHESVRTGFHDGSVGITDAMEVSGQPYERHLTLVCTHGRHDPCCAIRGRRLAAVLAAGDPDGTWECSHIGGCRFAPAMVLLPHGLIYGGVSPHEAPGVVRAYTTGIVDSRFLRGRSSLTPAAQTAQLHARAAIGATGTDDLQVIAATMIDASTWRVELTRPNCTVLLRERTVPVDRPLTCAAKPTGRMRVFDLLDLLDLNR